MIDQQFCKAQKAETFVFEIGLCIFFIFAMVNWIHVWAMDTEDLCYKLQWIHVWAMDIEDLCYKLQGFLWI